MSDLKRALLAAADEVENMSENIIALNTKVKYLEDENTKLLVKLKKATDCVKQFASILSED